MSNKRGYLGLPNPKTPHVMVIFYATLSKKIFSVAALKTFLGNLLCFLITISAYAQTTKRITAGMNLQTEINNAVVGDVFLVEGGNYGNLTITKKVTLIGTGYLLTSNGVDNVSESILGVVDLKAGSESSFIAGFRTDYIYISASNVIVARNYARGILIGHSYSPTTPVLTDNVIAKQNYIVETMQVYGSSTNFSIKSNIIYQGLHIVNAVNGILLNNTITFGTTVLGSPLVQYKNNIFVGAGGLNVSAYVFNYNVTTGSHPGANSTNKVEVSGTELFVGYPNNPNNLGLDARNQLATNSPAKGVGENGTDAGAFGGDEPYVLSGLPPIPIIYQLTAPSQAPQGGTLNVTIKAKTNN